ncbi:hypothetical protein AB870_10730 [Pandoraea faecigallinarum]|nr:hypothetical protein AB870_10730 [Pandoraea faecigallinarum]
MSHPRVAAAAAVAGIALCASGAADADMRMWKRGASAFNAVIFLQNTGSQVQHCDVSWGNASGGFGNSRNVFVKPGETVQIETQVVAVNEHYQCWPYTDPFAKRQDDERRRQEIEAQRRQKEEEAKRRQAAIWQKQPNANPPAQGTSQPVNTVPMSAPQTMPAPGYDATPVYPSAPIVTAPTASGNASTLGAAIAVLGTVGQALESMSQTADAEAMQRSRDAALSSQIEEQARRSAAGAAQTDPWKVSQ